MGDDARGELERLWDQHLAIPFPDEWSKGASSDARLARYFDVCSRSASDHETHHKVAACRAYFEHLNHMLEVGRRVPAR